MVIVVENMAFGRNGKNAQIASPENACVQEDAASADLPDLEHNAAQLCPLVGHVAHLLLRMRGPLMGHRQTGDINPFFLPYAMVTADLDKSLWVPRNAKIAGNSPEAFNY